MTDLEAALDDAYRDLGEAAMDLQQASAMLESAKAEYQSAIMRVQALESLTSADAGADVVDIQERMH